MAQKQAHHLTGATAFFKIILDSATTCVIPDYADIRTPTARHTGGSERQMDASLLRTWPPRDRR